MIVQVGTTVHKQSLIATQVGRDLWRSGTENTLKMFTTHMNDQRLCFENMQTFNVQSIALFSMDKVCDKSPNCYVE